MNFTKGKRSVEFFKKYELLDHVLWCSPYGEVRAAKDREFQQDMDVLDQTPGDDPGGPDIDG